MTTTDSDSCWVRQNFHVDCENAINKQINMELHASYVYLSMVSHIYTIECMRIVNLRGQTRRCGGVAAQ